MKPAAAKVLKEQQEKYGKAVVFPASAMPPLRRVPTGSLMLDAATGGGWPRGRVSEVYGFEHSGKTSLMLITMAQAQARGEDCYYCCPERSWAEKFSKALGVKAADLALSLPRTGEEGMLQVIDAVKSGAFSVVGLDSITAFTPSQILDKGVERSIGVEAYFNNLFCKLCVLANQDCALIIINQPRVRIGGPVGLPPEPGGGQGLKHHKSLSIELSKGPWLAEDGTELKFGTRKKKAGFVVRFKIRKNRTAPPYREGSYRFYFLPWAGGGPGIDAAFDVQRLRRMHGIKKTAKVTEAQLRAKGWPEGY